MIFITGIPRSRTSMTAAMLEACGADFGNQGHLQPPHPSNPLGFYEHQRVRFEMQRPYFERIGFDPRCRTRLPKKEDIVIEQDWRKQFEEIMGEPTPNLTHKEPKLCMYWELWHFHFPEAKWVIIRRNHEDLLCSVSERTPWMAGALKEGQWQAWMDHHELRIKEMKRRVSWREVDTDQIVQGDFKQLRSVVVWLGLQWRQKKVEKLLLRDSTHYSRGHS